MAAIADSFAALVSPRPYRRPVSVEEAYEELRRAAQAVYALAQPPTLAQTLMHGDIRPAHRHTPQQSGHEQPHPVDGGRSPCDG